LQAGAFWPCSCKTIELTDEQYSALETIAARDGETPQRFIERLLAALAQTRGTIYYSDGELLRALGGDDQESKER
jgi:hypothetical protein